MSTLFSWRPKQAPVKPLDLSVPYSGEMIERRQVMFKKDPEKVKKIVRALKNAERSIRADSL